VHDPEDKTTALKDDPQSETTVVNPEGRAGDNSQLIDDDIVAEFLSRQGESLEYVENLVLDIETNETDSDLPDLMRIFHTLKGEASLLGYEDVSRLAHKTEDLLQREPLGACVDRILDVKDWLAVKFESLTGEGEAPGPLEELIESLEKSLADKTPPSENTEAASAAVVESGEPTYYDLDLHGLDVDMLQDFIAEAGEHLEATEGHLLDLEHNPTDEEGLNAVFRCFHTIKGVAGFVEMDHIKELAHKAENLLSLVRKGEKELSGDVMDLAFASVDMLKRLNDDVTSGMAGDGRLARRVDLQQLIDRIVANCDGEPSAAVPEASAALATRAPAGNTSSGLVILPKARKAEAAKGVPAAKDAVKDGSSGLVILSKKHKTAAAPPAKPTGQVNTAATNSAAPSATVARREAVRVDAERLDLMVETIGELVIAEAMVSQSRELRSIDSIELSRSVDHLDKICRELQEIGLSLRMVPVRPIFQKMARLVRDLAKKSGRKIEFSTDGEDTELDKTVVDKIGDPLVHMLRNAVDHGIESDEQDRIAAGKTAEGNISMRAFHKGGNIIIEVEDDGRGLDREVILAKAVGRGLVAEGAKLSDREVYGLIFEAGFSTAKTVTDVSGRGVGMDVVRRNIDALRGSVDITSRPGRGSVFSLKLPLTLAIIEGMVFSTGVERYIIPTLNVVRLIRPKAEDYTSVMDTSEMLRFEEEMIPLIRLHQIFNIDDAHEDVSQGVVIVAESDGRRIGLLADELIGQQQIVIKSLGNQVQKTDGLAGGAIMSDGNVALILDVAGLVKAAHEEKSATYKAGGRS
jgi:two-component system, chemotaxis family, sensor kinase CheA